MKNIEILLLQKAITDCGSLSGVKFAYGLSKNVNILQKEIEALENAIKPTIEYQTYDTQRIELAKKYSTKDAQGQPVTTPIDQNRFNYSIDDKEQSHFDEDSKKLQIENKEIIKSRDTQIKEYTKLLDSVTTDIKLYKINISDVPENITVEQLLGIRCLIDDAIKNIEESTK